MTKLEQILNLARQCGASIGVKHVTFAGEDGVAMTQGEFLAFARGLTDEIEQLRKGHARYETARRMNARLWADAWKENTETGRPFDEIIDEWRPHFYSKK